MRKIMVVAHKGGGVGIFENKLETIKETSKQDHIDAIEVDVRLTKDGVLVVHHDRGVYIHEKRIWIDKVEYEKIKHLGIATLEEVVSLLEKTSKMINIDIKEERCTGPLKVFFSKHKVNGKFFFDCFDANVLLELQETIPGGEYFLSLNPKDSFDFHRRFIIKILILLSTIFFSQFIFYFLKKKIKKVKIDGISVYYKFANRKFIEDLNSFGFKVFIWGTDRELEIQKFLNTEIYGIKTRNISFFEKLT